MLTFKIQNYNIEGFEKSFLSAAVSAGGASLGVDNSQGFAADDYVIAGNYRSEEAQLRQVGSVSGLNVILSSVLSVGLSSGDSVTKIPYNQVILQESDDGLTGWSDVVTQSIDVDSEYSNVEYSTASASKYYRYYFKNETTLVTSPYSASMLGNERTEGTLGWFIYECARDVRDENYQVFSEGDWRSYIKTALRMLFPRVHTPVDATTSSSANTYSYAFPSGISHVDKVFIQEGTNRPLPLSNVRVFNEKLKFDADLGDGYTIILEGREYFTVPDSNDDDLGLQKMHYELVKWQAEYLAFKGILMDKSKLNQYSAEVKNTTENDVLNMLSLLRADIKDRLGETTPTVESYDIASAY
jgi:hypothetical protein